VIKPYLYENFELIPLFERGKWTPDKGATGNLTGDTLETLMMGFGPSAWFFWEDLAAINAI